MLRSYTTGRNLGIEIASDPISLLVVSVAEAKTFLSVNHTEHDSMIEDFILSATRDIEHYTRRALPQRSHTVYFRQINEKLIKIPRPPHVIIDTVTRVDQDGTETALTDYDVVGNNSKSIILSGSSCDAVRIEYTAGYGLLETDIPQALRTAVKWQLKLYYNNRNTGQDDFVQVDRRSGLVVQAKSAADGFVFYYELG